MKDQLFNLLIEYYYLDTILKEKDKEDPERFKSELEKETLTEEINKILENHLPNLDSEEEKNKKINTINSKIIEQMKFSNLPLVLCRGIAKYDRIGELKINDYLIKGNSKVYFKQNMHLRGFGQKAIPKILHSYELLDGHYKSQTEYCLKHVSPFISPMEVLNYEQQEKQELLSKRLDDFLQFLYAWASLPIEKQDIYCFHPHTKKQIDKISEDPKYIIELLSNCSTTEELTEEPEKVFSKFMIKK